MSLTSTIDTTAWAYREELIDSSGNPITGVGGLQVVGSVASGSTDSGNPVKVGGVYNSSPITLTNGQRGDLQLDVNGNLKTTGGGGGSSTQYTSGGSAVPTPTGGALIYFNGSNVPVAVTSSNPLPVTGGGGSATFGSAFPSTGTAVGFTDGTNMRGASVAIFHNTDNQVLTGSSYGLLTGGVAQILNPTGSLDRQRGTGFDGIGATGVATGTQQLASSLLSTTSTTTITGSGTAQNIPVVSSASIVIGDQIKIVDNGAGVEYTEVLSVPDATHFNAVVKNTHTQPNTFTWNHFNQAKDATIGDNAALTGIGASSNYLINFAGGADKQRSAGFDNVPAFGNSGSTNLNAVPVSFTITPAITLSTTAQTVAVSSISNLYKNSVVSVDTGASQEYVVLTVAPSGGNITAIFTKNHSATVACTSFYYVQQRDASIGDNQPLLGQNISVTGLWNPTTALVELERSALGANDNDNGKGAAIAVEYEWSGQGYDRGRNMQSKGFNSRSFFSTDTGGYGVGTNQIQITGATPVGLIAGAAVQLLGGVIETAYVSLTWTPSTTITFQSNIAQSGHNTLIWETFAANGPGLAGFTPIGIGIEEDSVYDPVSGYMYIERSATQDGVSGQNIVVENEGLYNGSTFDRSRGGITGAQSSATGFANELEMIQYNTVSPTLTAGQLVNTQSDVNGNLKVTEATLLAGEDLVNGYTVNMPKSKYLQLSASGQIKATPGVLIGVFVSSASSTPTIKIWDSTTGSGSIFIDTFTPVAGTYYPLGFGSAGTGLYASLGGTISCTFYYQ